MDGRLRFGASSSSSSKRRRGHVSQSSTLRCAFCEARKAAPYTCPRCQAPYCSLDCYGSKAHSSCADEFAKEELRRLAREERPSQGDRAKEDEQRKVLEMLKRLEDNDKGIMLDEDDEEEESEEGDEWDALRARLEKAALDGEDLSDEALLAMLSADQRAAFDAALADPSERDALLRAYDEHAPVAWWLHPSPDEVALKNDEDETPVHVAPGSASEDEEDDQEEEEVEREPCPPPRLLPLSSLPPMRRDPTTQEVIARPELLHNLLAILLGYAHAIRACGSPSFDLLSTSSEAPQELKAAREHMARLAPLLVEQSAFVLASIIEAVEYVSSRATDEPGSSLHDNLLRRATLLQDAAVLLRPRAVQLVEDAEAAQDELARSPTAKASRALSDLAHLFTTGSGTRKAHQAAARKVTWYASFVASAAKGVTDTQSLGSFTTRLEGMAQELRSQADEREGGGGTGAEKVANELKPTPANADIAPHTTTATLSKPKIEVID